MVDVEKEFIASEEEAGKLFDKKPNTTMGEYVKDGERYLALGTFVDMTRRLNAIKAKEQEHSFDEFELERPLAWWVVIVKIQEHNREVIISSPQTVRVDVFKENFKAV